MKKLAHIISSIFNKQEEGPTTTQMAMGLETGQIQGLRLIKKIPFFGNMSFRSQYKVLNFILVPAIVASLAAAGTGLVLSSYNNKRVERSNNLSMLAQHTARLATQVAISGDKKLILSLAESRTKMNDYLSDLLDGTKGLQKASGLVKVELEELQDIWNPYNVNIEALTNSGEALREVHYNMSNIIDTSNTGNALLDKIRTLAVQKGLSNENLYTINALGESLNELHSTALTLNNTVNINDDVLQSLLKASEHAKSVTKTINEDVSYMDKSLTDYVKLLNNVITSMGDLNSIVEPIYKSKNAKNAATLISEQADAYWSKVNNVTSIYSVSDRVEITFYYMLAIAAAVAAASVGIFLTWLKLQESKLSAAQIEESIMNLMNDMMDISDGNLALRARVAENVTGSIADSLNLTVARLNQTITNVKETSTTVLNSTHKVNDEAQIILGAVQLQADKIKQASAMVNSISDSVQAVAFAAEQSADVAREQMEATTEGRTAVEEAKQSMLSIRDQIQETAKRIKRLGESAQEIDEIIELISDTTEQTNVLAMNASIQAAAAGEAGRGFRAVATEVQRLAERSDSSLKRIVALIRAIQADTQNAVAAMERSTQQVVNGANVTEQAGSVFIRIEDVSRQLTELISDISIATQSQSDEAKGITANMDEILSIADNTATGVEEATSGIQNISKLAEDLDESMNQFKLS